MTIVTSGKKAPDGSGVVTTLTFGAAKGKPKSYETVGSWIYPGSLKVGSPSRISVIAGASSGGTVDVRVYDVTNSKVVAELTDFPDKYPSIALLGAGQNASAGQSIWELQYRRGGSDKTVYCGTVTLEY